MIQTGSILQLVIWHTSNLSTLIYHVFLFEEKEDKHEMQSEIIVAILAFVGTTLGSVLGVITSSKLTTYRIEQLEIKVDKHNTVIERTYKLEEQIKVANHRIEDLEKEK